MYFVLDLTAIGSQSGYAYTNRDLDGLRAIENFPTAPDRPIDGNLLRVESDCRP